MQPTGFASLKSTERRSFLKARGFTAAAMVPEFYADGYAKVIHGKKLGIAQNGEPIRRRELDKLH